MGKKIVQRGKQEASIQVSCARFNEAIVKRSCGLHHDAVELLHGLFQDTGKT